VKPLHVITILRIVPLAKPRMTRADRWKHRKCVARYWAWCDAIRLQAKQERFSIPSHGYHVTFHMPMAKSWSKKKRAAHDGQPHQQKPDKDNLEKAFLDALLPDDDSHVWDGRATKLWSSDPRIEIVDYGEVNL